MDRNLPPCRKYRTCALAWAFTILLQFAPAILPAQTFEAETDTREVVLGSAFEVSFTLKDAQGARFVAPDFSNFKVVSGPSEMRGMTIINGRSTTRQSWSFELEPKRTGNFSIGSASITVNGKTLTTNTLAIKVVPARDRSNVNVPPGATDNLFIAGELDRENACPGQQVTWRIKLYTQLSIEGADIIELPDFEGFYSKEKRRFDTRVTYQTIRGKRYAVKVLHEEALFPLEAGELTVGPAKVRIGVEQPGRFGSFLIPKPVLFQTQPIALKVKPLPAPAPEKFTGGVGRYDWSVQLDRDSLSTDDAFSITLSVRGNGDAKRFAPPKLALPPGLESFDPKIKEEEEYENGEEVVHTKVLEYIILPKEPGEYRLAPELSYFDTDSNKFRLLRADSLPVVRITAGKNYGIITPVDTVAILSPVVAPEPGFLEKMFDWLQSPALWGILAIALLAYGVYVLLKKKKKVAPQPTRPARQQRPSSKTSADRFAQVRQLVHGGDPRAFYDELFKFLQAYLASRLALTPARMTQQTVQKMLSERGVASGTIQDLLSVWHTCEQALFAGQTQAVQMEPTLRTAQSVIQVLDKSNL